MGTKVWGPPLWKSLHFIALGYPSNPCPEQKARYKQFFTDLHHVIPCSICATNYQKHLAEVNIDEYLDNSAKLFEWTVKIHNIVNKQNGASMWTTENAKHAHLSELKYGHRESSREYNSNRVNVNNEQFIIPMIVLLISMAAIFISTIYFLKLCRITK